MGEFYQFAFSPAQIDVQKDDLVKITFTAVDIPHSFTVDGYRIAKRAGAGQTVVFEFRADRAGEHDFYCNLAQDERCRPAKMHAAGNHGCCLALRSSLRGRPGANATTPNDHWGAGAASATSPGAST